MEVLVNCGACPDLHRHQVDGVILLRHEPDGALQCPSYLYGGTVLAVVLRIGTTLEICCPEPIKNSKERKWIEAGIQHLQQHHHA